MEGTYYLVQIEKLSLYPSRFEDGKSKLEVKLRKCMGTKFYSPRFFMWHLPSLFVRETIKHQFSTDKAHRSSSYTSKHLPCINVSPNGRPRYFPFLANCASRYCWKPVLRQRKFPSIMRKNDQRTNKFSIWDWNISCSSSLIESPISSLFACTSTRARKSNWKNRSRQFVSPWKLGKLPNGRVELLRGDL